MPPYSPRNRIQLTDEALTALQYVWEDWELARMDDENAKHRLKKLASSIGKEAFRALHAFSIAHRIEDFEREMNWPARSGWLAISIIADFLINLQSERDLMVY